MKVRTIIAAVCTLLVLAVLSGMVVQKERLLSRGQRVYFKLAPRDPRSLMQGDYMALRYELAAKIQEIREKSRITSRTGIAIITLDERGVAVKARIEAGDRAAGPGEKLIRYKHVNGDISFGAGSFFFQEGKGSAFEKARYGELMLDDNGASVLVGLRDEDLEALKEK
jgi:uncharacterized membrane-anchored protein